MKKQLYGVGVFTLSKVFSDKECNKLIQYAEETGFNTNMDDPQADVEPYRVHDQLFLTDTQLAHKVYKRIQPQSIITGVVVQMAKV